MKKVETENYTLLVGETSDIKATYKSICRASQAWQTEVRPVFADSPVFSPNKKMYGLMIDPEGGLTVVRPDVALALLEEEGLIKAAI